MAAAVDLQLGLWWDLGQGQVGQLSHQPLLAPVQAYTAPPPPMTARAWPQEKEEETGKERERETGKERRDGGRDPRSATHDGWW